MCNGCNFHELLGREICGQRFAYFGGLDALVCGKYYRAASPLKSTSSAISKQGQHDASSLAECLRVVAAALLREVAEVVPLSDPRAQLPEMRLSKRTGA